MVNLVSNIYENCCNMMYFVSDKIFGVIDDLEQNISEELQSLRQQVQQCFTQDPPSPCSDRCNCSGPWRRVIYLNMTEPDATCPTGWQKTNYSIPTCGRVLVTQLSSQLLEEPTPEYVGPYKAISGVQLSHFINVSIHSMVQYIVTLISVTSLVLVSHIDMGTQQGSISGHLQMGYLSHNMGLVYLTALVTRAVSLIGRDTYLTLFEVNISVKLVTKLHGDLIRHSTLRHYGMAKAAAQEYAVNTITHHTSARLYLSLLQMI